MVIKYEKQLFLQLSEGFLKIVNFDLKTNQAVISVMKRYANF